MGGNLSRLKPYGISGNLRVAGGRDVDPRAAPAGAIMLDLVEFAEPLLPADSRLRADPGMLTPPAAVARQGVHWWLVHEDVEPDEILMKLLTVMQRGKWKRIAQEKMNFLLEGPGGRVLLQVDDAPCREVTVMSAAGEPHQVVRWPEFFDGRVVVLVKVV